jgi:putative tryptophan/tyrosine transport system substrate-binding protein
MRKLTVWSLIACVVVAWSPTLQAQRAQLPVIGFLSTASPNARGGEQVAAFHRGLQEAGFTEGQNVEVDYRWAADDYARLPELSSGLVQRRVSVIVAAGGHVSALAAHEATKEIPIVFTTVTDPVKAGLVESLNKPGGNVTGTAGLTSELDPKRLELLHEAKPTATVIGVLVNPNRPGLDDQLQAIRVAADKVKVKLQIQSAATAEEIDIAFQAFASQRVDGLLVTADPFFNNRRTQVVALAARHSIPAIYQWREFATAGGLMSYGPSILDAYRQAGINAGRVLKGAKPADMPVVQPTRFYWVINRKIASQIGLNLPSAVLVLADELLE